MTTTRFPLKAGWPPVVQLSNIDGINGFILDGINANDRSGYAVSAAGDVNGDGFDDVIIGAFYADPGGRADAGESYVVFGQAGPFPTNFALSSLNGSNGFVLEGIDSGDRSAQTVSAAGDINGDGFDDVIIGAVYADPMAGNAAGESYVVFGQAGPFPANFALSNLNGTNGFILEGINAVDLSGAVSAAGDINGDGIDDLIIGARGADPGGKIVAGESYVVFGQTGLFPGIFALSSLNGSNGFILEGIDAFDSIGRAVGAVGDINGDGFDDLIIGAGSADSMGVNDAGESYVVFGRTGAFPANFELSSLNGTNGFILEGIDAYDNSGKAVSAAGDINGDGFDDLIIGADNADPFGANEAGESYVVFGRVGPYPANFALSSLNGTNGFTLDGIDAFDISGFAVSAAGDINGDGFDDLIIGAYRADQTGAVYVGESYVVFGQKAPFPANLALSSLTGSNGFILEGIDAGDSSGRSVGAAGDINGDGIDDLIIGAWGADPIGGGDAGESYVVFGESLIVYQNELRLPPGETTRWELSFKVGQEFSTPAGFPLYTITSAYHGQFEYLSAPLVAITSFDQADVDNQTVVFISDTLGSPGAELTISNGAQLSLQLSSIVKIPESRYLFSNFALTDLDGSNGFILEGIDANDNSGIAVSAAGDINGDGIDDLIIGARRADPGGRYAAGESYLVFGQTVPFPTTLQLSSLNGNNGVIIEGIDPNDNSGIDVSAAGDINGDGIDDLIIGADRADPMGRNEAGECYVVFGHTGPFPATMQLSSLNGSNGFILEGIVAADYSGSAVSAAGDINGDGIDDLIIGDYRADPMSGVDAGESYVVFGQTVPFPTTLQLSSLNGTNGFIIEGIVAGDKSGRAISAAGDINGDGIDDVIIGARTADPGGRSNAGESYVVFGQTGSFPANFALSSLNGSNGFILEGIDAVDISGELVSSFFTSNGAARPNTT